jgi:hypothetical protein
VLILFGLLGLALGAFQWTASPWFVDVKQFLAELLVDRGIVWPLETAAPWWILTNYPEQNDVMTLLDGFVLLSYMLATAVAMGCGLGAVLALATRAAGAWSWQRFHHLAQSLVPLGGCGVFLGLSALSVTLLRSEGLALPWVGAARATLLTGAALWSVFLAWRIAGLSVAGARRIVATALVAIATLLASGGWVLLFWGR